MNPVLEQSQIRTVCEFVLIHEEEICSLNLLFARIQREHFRGANYAQRKCVSAINFSDRQFVLICENIEKEFLKNKSNSEKYKNIFI